MSCILFLSQLSATTVLLFSNKSKMEAKCLKMNTGKTKVMFSCSMKDTAEEKVSSRVVYVRRELAVIRFCATVAHFVLRLIMPQPVKR